MKNKLYIIVILLLFFLNLFILISFSQPIPLIPTPVEPSLIVKAPLYVNFNKIFTVEAIFLEGSYGFSEFYSITEQIPSGFKIIERGKFGMRNTLLGKEGYYQFIVKAPASKMEKQKIRMVMHYKAGLFKKNMRIHGDHTISVDDPLRIKYRVNFNSVPSDYNGDIKLAALVEAFPTFMPLGYFILGEKREENTWENTYAMDSLIAKFVGSLALLGGLSSSDKNATMPILGAGIYLYSLIFYDLPNLHKSHEARIEVAKMKREGKIK